MRDSKVLLIVLCLMIGIPLLFYGFRAVSVRDYESFDEAMVRDVAMAESHTLFVLEDNALWGVGSNEWCELGVNKSHPLISEQTADGFISYTYRPVQIMTDVQAAGGGMKWSVALKTDGTLWFMGDRDVLWRKESEQKPAEEYTLPVMIMEDVKSIACGDMHLLILKQDGTLWGMGNSYYGQLATLGQPHMPYHPLSNAPVQIVEGVVSIFASYRSTFFIDEQNRLFSCGGEGFGELGYLPSEDDESSVARSERYSANPEPTLIMDDAAMVAAGNTLTLILDQQGDVFGAGISKNYELGFLVEQTEQPLAVASGVKRVAVGGDETWGFSLLLMEDNTLWGMGDNQYGQLLPDGPTLLTEPTKLLDEVKSMWANDNGAIIQTLDGKMIYQGKSDCGELLRKAD